jgi:hypothetical protein
LKSFIEKLGYDAILSEYNDIFFNPEDHTHESCVKDIINSDIVILIIGSRFGGQGIPSLKSLVDFGALASASSKHDILNKKEQLSITQYEVLKAVEANIPIYTFVEDNVYHDHNVYEHNKDNSEIISKMNFPSIPKRETAPYIFEFINFMRARTHNNALFVFNKFDDMEDILLKQWSNLFQSLLSESKTKRLASSQMNQISNQLDDMKALIMSSVNKENSKDAAKGVLKFRSLINYIDGLLPNPDLIYKNQSWADLMRDCNIIGTREFENKEMKKRIAIVKKDNSFYLPTLSFNDDAYEIYKKEWPAFAEISEATKKIIVEAVRDTSSRFRDLRYYDISIDDYINNLRDESSKSDDSQPF